MTTIGRRFAPRVMAVALLCILAACAGGTSSSIVPSHAQAQRAGAKSKPAMARVKFTILIRKHRRGGKKSDYISPSTKSATVAVGDAAAVPVNLTLSSPGCSTSLPLSCTVDIPAKPGQDTFTVTLFDGKNGTGNRLSTGTAVSTVVAGKTNSLTVVCNGIVASLGLTLAEPSPIQGFAQTIGLTLSALDADGNTIIAPGTYNDGPITVADADTTHSQLQLGSAAAASSVSVTGPGQTVNVLYDGSSALTSAELTATMPAGAGVTAASTSLTPTAAQVVVDTANGSPAISQDMLGANLPAWTDNTSSYMAPAFTAAGLHLVRWPGGSLADEYYWGDGGTPSECNGAYADNSDSTFDNFMKYVAEPASVDVAITLNYGSNSACSGPGTPAEAATWVTYAKNKGYNVKYWTVGNENYGSWEYDLHTSANNPSTYAAAVTGTSGFYKKIKAANSAAKVGVVVGGPAYWSSWDNEVLSGAAGYFDYVEYHYYAQQGVGAGSAPGDAESDSYLLGQGVTDFANSLQSLRTEMTDDGVATTVPIYLGELNSIVSTAGKQTTSITNGLFAGMAMAEAMKSSAGVQMGTWWLGFGDCEDAGSGGNFSSSLYGWQTFGTYTLFSDQSSGCGSGSYPESSVPAGTPFPDGRAFGILSQFAGQGSVIRNVTTGVSTTDARFYADTLGSGYGVLLFNLNETTPVTYTVLLSNASATQFTATQTVYGKAQYDDSQNNVWTAPVTTSLGTVPVGFSVTLAPWSMNLVTLVPVTSSDRHAHGRGATKPQ